MSSLFQVCGRKELFNLPRGCICMLLRADGGEPSVGHASGCELYCTPESYTQKNSTASERSGGCLWETGRRKRRNKWQTVKADRRKLWCRRCQPGAERLHQSPGDIPNLLWFGYDVLPDAPVSKIAQSPVAHATRYVNPRETIKGSQEFIKVNNRDNTLTDTE